MKLHARSLLTAVLATGLLFGAACGDDSDASTSTPDSTSSATSTSSGDWSAAPNTAAAAEQAKDFQTYGMPDDWANYGQSIAKFCEKNGFTCKRTDTDMSSAEEIQKFDAEQGNPIAVMADIGIIYGPIAEKQSVVPGYLPPNAEKVPAAFKSASGGWVGTFVGVPAFVVNTDVVKNVPRTWDDLLKPEYKGLIASPGDPRKSGTAATTFIAWAYAHGGDEKNLQPGIDFAKQILPQYSSAEGSIEVIEKGEVGIWLRYDFNAIAAAEALKAKGIGAEVVIPGVSIYAPSALMLNKYNTGKSDLAKMFADWVLSDEGQTVFAEFGARPVRYVLGDLQLPDSAKAKWLPDDQYAQVKQVGDWSAIDAATIAEVWETQVLAGS